MKYDKFGNEILYRKYGGMEGNVHDSTREINDYTYNTTTGLPESSILSLYNSDNDTMVPVARSIYSDYIDIAGVETNLFDTNPSSLRYASGIIYTDGQICRIYNTSGALVAESSDEMIDTRNLAEGIYIARTADKSLKFRK